MKCKLRNSELRALASLLDVYCDQLRNSPDMEDKLHLSVLESIRITLEQKLIMRKDEYRIKFKPHEALCMWLNFSHRVTNTTDHTGNTVRMLCNAIHQQYA
jgi:hypothetical protein